MPKVLHTTDREGTPIAVRLLESKRRKDDESQDNELDIFVETREWFRVTTPPDWDEVVIWFTDADIDGSDDVGAPGLPGSLILDVPGLPRLYITQNSEATAQRVWGMTDNTFSFCISHSPPGDGVRVHIKKD